MLFNEPKLLKCNAAIERTESGLCFSALQRAEIAEMAYLVERWVRKKKVSVLFNEPKLLKFHLLSPSAAARERFSALQRAEIAEMRIVVAEHRYGDCFSALQRAEIAEMRRGHNRQRLVVNVSVLFNEPKLLKSKQ